MEKVAEKEKEKTDELLENVESLQSNIQERIEYHKIWNDVNIIIFFLPPFDQNY